MFLKLINIICKKKNPCYLCCNCDEQFHRNKENKTNKHHANLSKSKVEFKIVFFLGCNFFPSYLFKWKTESDKIFRHLNSLVRQTKSDDNYTYGEQVHKNTPSEIYNNSSLSLFESNGCINFSLKRP